MKIGYLGPPGTLTEEAVGVFTQALDIPIQETDPVAGLPSLLEGLNKGEYHLAVLPAENSLEGSVNTTWDWLVFRLEVQIVGECTLPVRHFLVGHRAQKLGEIRTVLSHPQALAQCREFVRTHLPRAKEYETVSTAEAARIVSVNRLPVAAIASAKAAHLYGLDILAEDIQDVKENYTRFLLLGRKPVSLTGNHSYKSALVCGVEKDRPGGLWEILDVFAKRNINLTRIESRPARKSLGDYIFLIDLEGRLEDSAVAEALAELEAKKALIKILGSYPVLKV
ncbi:MAG: prephenate dehydratase [Firmicutes bacterium]|nr:prephenate dehydratase [Bacillota bacterium]